MTAAAGTRGSMRALVLHAAGDARLEEVPRPEPGPGEVLVRVGFCGVCGSDIPRIFTKGTYRFPTICGHEFAGTVEAAGPQADDLVLGTPVAVFPLIWCGRCAECEAGRYARCGNYDYLGSRRDGAFAEYVVAPRRNLVPVPEGVTLEEAAMTEPAAVALHALKRGGGTAPGETVAVIGAGPIGLLVAQWARILGASRVAIFDILAERLETARKLRFEWVFDASAESPAAALARIGAVPQLVVEAAGAPAAIVSALEAAGSGGRVVLLGNPAGDVKFEEKLLSGILRRELDIRGTWNSDFSAAGRPDDWRAALDAMAKGTLDVRSLVSHRVPLARALEVLEALRRGDPSYGKVLVQP